MSNKTTKPPLLLGGLEVTQSVETATRMALLLWGDINVGKTTLAATAPGNKLWLNLDNEGVQSILHRKDVQVVDLTGLTVDELFNRLQSDNPLGLDKFLHENQGIDTIILDSATALAWNALQKAVDEKVGSNRKESFVPTIMAPGISAYGGRNNVVIQCVAGLLKITAKHNRHLIVITHEDDAKTDNQGVTTSIGMILGGKTVKQFAWRLSEIWYMSLATGSDRKRKIAVRPTRLRAPMKTRIFAEGPNAEFTLSYDPEKPDKGQPHTIAALYSQWLDGGMKKLVVPSK